MKMLLAVVLFLSAAAPVSGEEAVSREEFDQLKSELAELKSRAVPLESDQTGEGEAPAGEPIFGEYWDDGLRAVSRDGKFDVRIGGRIHIDGAFFRSDSEIKSAAAAIPGNDPFESGWEVRHPRIY
jgi:hypothetical protein